MKAERKSIMADFESILDDCLREIAAGHETLESCLRRYPAHAARLAPVLEVAERLRRVPPAPAMPADKRRVLESRYLRRAAQLHLQRDATCRCSTARDAATWMDARDSLRFSCV